MFHVKPKKKYTLVKLANNSKKRIVKEMHGGESRHASLQIGGFRSFMEGNGILVEVSHSRKKGSNVSQIPPSLALLQVTLCSGGSLYDRDHPVPFL